MELIYIIIIILLVVIIENMFNTCNIEGVRANKGKKKGKKKKSQDQNTVNNDNISYAKNPATGDNSFDSQPNHETLRFTGDDDTGKNPLFYVCGNASSLMLNDNSITSEWNSNVCSPTNCKLERCKDGDTSCITDRNNTPVRLGEYCDKYDESGGSETLNADFESYVSQFLSCPNEGDEIFKLNKTVFKGYPPSYDFVRVRDGGSGAKTGLCGNDGQNGVFEIYDGPFPETTKGSGVFSHGSGTAFTCEAGPPKNKCNRDTDKLWQILT